jgi:hypothetical protein
MSVGSVVSEVLGQTGRSEGGCKFASEMCLYFLTKDLAPMVCLRKLQPNTFRVQDDKDVGYRMDIST